MTFLIALAFAIVAVLSTCALVVPIPSPFDRLAPVALGLSGAYVWHRVDWPLYGLGAAGISIVVPLLLDRGTTPGVRRPLPPRGLGTRVPPLP